MDTISDMLTRIRNAQAVQHPSVKVSFSKTVFRLAEILAKEGFIGQIKKRRQKERKLIRIDLKYTDTNTPVISGLKRISKPGQRIYKKSKELGKSKGGYVLAIVSTPKGLMTDREAKKQNLGGEVLCEIW